jgi:hypothetical protein
VATNTDGARVADDDDFDPDFDDEFEPEPIPLDEHESAMVQQDLVDLESFEATFAAEGYRGVSVYCHDCAEEHYYPWELLRGNLQLLLETGETPVHEPAFAPNPDQYIPWEYARGYVDALSDVGVDQRRPVGVCPRCALQLPVELAHANFCPRCSMPLLGPRLVEALTERGYSQDDISSILREMGLPG